MPTLSIAEFLKEQQARLEEGRQQIATTRLAGDSGKPLPPDSLRDNHKREVANLRSQIARTTAARAEALARYDGQIQRLKEALERAEEEGKKIDEVLSGRIKPRPERKANASGAKKERVGRKK